MITRPSIQELLDGIIGNLERVITEPDAGNAQKLATPLLAVVDRVSNEWSGWAGLLQDDNTDLRATLAALGATLTPAPATELPSTSPAAGLAAVAALEADNRTLRAALVATIERLDLPAEADASSARKHADQTVLALLSRMLHRETQVRVTPARVPPTSGNPNNNGLTRAALSEILERFLTAEMPMAQGLQIEALDRLIGGASREAWVFDLRWTEEGQARSEPCILMREPIASVLVSDSSADRIDGTRRTVASEVRVVRAMAAAGLPVPEILWADTEGTWLERPFSIARRLPGTADVSNIIGTASAERLLNQFVATLARIHALDPATIGIDFLGTPSAGSAAQEQVRNMTRNFDAQRLEDYPATTYMIRWLEKHAPVADRVGVVHGDYRLGNLLHRDGDIIAVLDWEQVHIGDPLEEIAFMYWAMWSLESVCPIESFITRYETASDAKVNRETLAYYRVFIEFKMLVVLLTGLKSWFATPERQLHYGSAQTNEMIRDAQLRVIEELARGGPTVAFDAYQKRTDL